MERWRDRTSERIQAIRNCVSAVSRQTRESEVDVPSRRHFRLIYGSGSPPSAPLKNAAAGPGGVVAHRGIGVWAVMDCLNDAKNRVERSRTDCFARKFCRKLPE